MGLWCVSAESRSLLSGLEDPYYDKIAFSLLAMILWIFSNIPDRTRVGRPTGTVLSL